LLEIKHGEGKKITWSAKRARFRVDGKEIPIKQILAEVARLELSISARLVIYAQNLKSGKWTYDKWLSEMEKLLQDSHLIFAALALGGLAAAAANATVERRSVRDVTYAKNFGKVLESPKPPSPAATISRARSYVRSLGVTHQILSHRAHIIAGYTEAKRILTPAEHCRTKVVGVVVLQGCYEVALRGWLPIREMPPIGTLVCKQYCKCYIVYRK
jgi:hypothetical protein